VINAGDMKDCNKVAIPAQTTPVGTAIDGFSFKKLESMLQWLE
jgi:hypothetical protein